MNEFIPNEDEKFETDGRISIGSACLNQAIDESDVACAWLKNYSLKQDVFNLGGKVSNIYLVQYEYLLTPDHFSSLAIKYYWIAQRTWEIEWFMGNNAGLVPTRKECRQYTDTFDCDNEPCVDRGEAFAYFLKKIAIHEQHFRSMPGWSISLLLTGIAMHWLCEADELMAAGDTLKALDAMADAFSALRISAWGGAFTTGKELAADEKSAEATRKANLRHVTTHKMRQQVIDYCIEHIFPVQPDLPNDSIADLLLNKFPSISYRTLSTYVSKAKKQMRIP